MDDAFETPAFRVLRALLREGPMNHRRFTEVCRHASKASQALREHLKEAGYIVVKDSPTGRRITRSIQIELTPAGRKMAELNVQQEEIDERLKRQRGK